MVKKQYKRPVCKEIPFKMSRIICGSPLDSDSASAGSFEVDDNYDEME